MGFACPVCEIPHQDETHLANHLAFTAMTHGDDHEAWLDDHVPGWSGYGETDLAAEVAERAPEAEYDRVFEDTVRDRGGVGARQHDHNHDHGGAPAGVDPEAAAAAGRGELDEAARAVLDEARGLTSEMFGRDTEEGGGRKRGDAWEDGRKPGAAEDDASDRDDASGGDSPGEYGPGLVARSENRDRAFEPGSVDSSMPACPDCGDDTTKRMAVIEPSELKSERDYCLTCEKYVDDDARAPNGGE